MQTIRWLTAAFTLAALASLPVVARAQGEKTEMMSKERMGKAALSVVADFTKTGRLAFNATDIAYEVITARDAASGMASGRRQHKPVTLTAEIGDWSVKLYQAMETNELLKSVAIELGAGHALTLKNAHVSSMRLGTDANGKIVQEVSFFGQTFEMK